jgi:hypothetical protein
MEHNLGGYAKYYSCGSIKISRNSEFAREIDHSKSDFSKDGRSNDHKTSGVDHKSKDICSWHSLHNLLQNSVVDISYAMLLGRPWLRDIKMAHDWGSNIVTHIREWDS